MLEVGRQGELHETPATMEDIGSEGLDAIGQLQFLEGGAVEEEAIGEGCHRAVDGDGFEGGAVGESEAADVLHKHLRNAEVPMATRWRGRTTRRRAALRAKA